MTPTKPVSPSRGGQPKREEIKNPSRQQIEEYLAVIGWSLHNHGCDTYYFYNYKKKVTSLKLLHDHLEIEAKNYDRSPAIYFYLKDIKIKLHEENNCVSFRGIHDKNIFLQLRNYKKMKKQPKREIKAKCQCPELAKVLPEKEHLYSEKEKSGMNHKPNECKGTNELKLYRRGDGTTLWLCSCCTSFGDVIITLKKPSHEKI